MKKFLKLPYLAVFAAALVVIGIAGFVIFRKYRENQALLKPQDGTQVDVQKTIAEVGKVIILPQGEVPTVATVSDISKLKDQQFFSNALNGDRVLIYQNARKAFLYRPSEKKIVEVAPVNVAPTAASGSAQPQVAGVQATPAPVIPPKFTIRNGTDVVGLARRYETALKEKIGNAEVVNRDNAAIDSYKETLLVALNDTARTEIEEVAKALGVKSASLPEGEKAPSESDFLVILGEDFTLNLQPTP
jgi:hypothetical protein